MPAYEPAEVERLAQRQLIDIRPGPLQDIYNYELDREDICEWFSKFTKHLHNKDCGFIKSRPTLRFPPDTISDYYQAYVDACKTTMFIKFAIYRGVLFVTSFKDYIDE